MADTRALKRILKNFESVNSKVEAFEHDAQISEIKTCLAMANDEWKDFQVIERSLSGKFTEAQLEVVEKIETMYFEIKQVLYRHEVNCETVNTQENTSMYDLMENQTQFVRELSKLNKRDSDVRLPRVNIPPFLGNYSEFPSFKDLFETSIDQNEGMSKVHKLQYLKSLLKGEAYNLIKHLSVTEGNYKEAWEKVKARYNKPKHVICNLLKQFMEQPVLHQSSAKGLRSLTDVSDEVIRGLHVLGEEAEKRDPWLIYILTHKLDAESKEAWAHASAGKEFPSLDTFIDFLHKRSDALECINYTQRPKPSTPKRVGAMTSQVTVKGGCPMCTGTHYLSQCSAYLKLPTIERKEFTVKNKLCFNCLSSTHQSVVCRSKYVCRICKRKHHVTLHPETNTDANNEERKEEMAPEPIKATESNVFVAVRGRNQTGNLHQAILPTAQVLIKDKYGRMQQCRALLDSGSQSSFMSENCAQRLQLIRQKAYVHITGLTSGNLISRGKSMITLRSIYDHNVKTTLEILIINHLPTQIPKVKINLDNIDFMSELNLADPHFDIPSPIDLLIGADKFFEILQSNQRRYNSLILNQTIFGWIISGQPKSADIEESRSFNTFTRDNTKLEETLRKFWEIEDTSFNINKSTPEEMECERIFTDTHRRTSDGRYVVKLPFKDNSTELGYSLQTATNRFRSLERKLAMNTELREAYTEQIREYINLGHMIEVPANYKHSDSYYLPHHAVTKESSSTHKVRIVFDGSSKTSSGVSLNDKLMVGPTIQPTLWDILLRFRTNKVALVADIEKMYRQVIISEEHRKYQTILWRERQVDALKSFQITRVTFGLASSAFLAIRAMQQLATETEDEEVKRRIISDFYVDDILTGSNDERQAAALKEKIVAYVLRFIHALKQPQRKIITQLTATEIQHAKLKCIMWVQRREYENDIQNLQRHKKVNSSSRLLSLAPFVDEEGILRVGGRLQNAACDFDSKHPIILPPKHIFTNRVVWDIHLSNFHAGPTLTSSLIRQKYWVINGRSRVRSILKKCVICARYAAKLTTQMMGNLPPERVNPTRPFENCGIDFAGPIHILTRKGRGHTPLTKGYICIFICLSVKAIHIEGVSDLTSEAFLAALKRFSARRGLPKRIYTDNGSNFVGAKRVLEQACKLIKDINNNYLIADYLSRNAIEWHFIPPMSPHFGGLWESAVKSVKRHLLKATHNINITFEEMTTLLCQIENILNSRPLYASSANDEYEILTPSHFLIGIYASSVPELDVNSREYLLSRWQIIQRRVQTYWNRYYLEYLNSLQQRQKWQKVQENIKIGDIVLLKEENTPVCKWPFGRVIQVHPGSDGLVRAVTLKTSTSTFQRPIVKLCKLPIG